MRISGAGNAPSLSASESSFALSIVNDPSICALPQHILLWIFGAVSKFPPTKIAIGLPIFASEMLQNMSFPLSSKLIATTGSHICDVLVLANLKYAPFRILFSLSVAGIQFSLFCTNTSSREYTVSTFPDAFFASVLSIKRTIVKPSRLVFSPVAHKVF
jgi:hypothetical protein